MTECYERGVLMMNRLLELQIIHGWDEHETFVVATSSINETMPISLHKLGESKPGSVPSPVELLEHVQLSNLFLCRKGVPP
jgi:hypothetical protein